MYKSRVFNSDNKVIKGVDILKIDNIITKSKELKIYNMHLQVYMKGEICRGYTDYLLSIGNRKLKGLNKMKNPVLTGF